jgi:hypothetical protein
MLLVGASKKFEAPDNNVDFKDHMGIWKFVSQYSVV